MAGIYITRGMTVGIPPVGFSLSFATTERSTAG
jgi:hypothetical protein